MMANLSLKYYRPLILIFILLTITNCSQNLCSLFEKEHKSPLEKFLSDNEQLTITPLPPDSIYQEKYKIMITQPIDHKTPGLGKFQQLIYLSHQDFNAPTVLITEGYSAGYNFCGELAPLLNANEIRVEHRYFGESKPDSLDWQYLTIKQAAADHHAIVQLFKTIYPGKWLNTGWSKGGQTSIFHRYYFPGDIDASVIYDSPINFALEDERINHFFETVGTAEARKKLVAFQRLVLSRKNDLLPLFKWYSKGQGYHYSIGLEKAFDYIVLEYPFSFWQYESIAPDLIPTSDADNDSLLSHLNNVVAFSSYADRSMNSPSMYQFATQLGYYGYVQKNVADLLCCQNYPNNAYAPQVTPLKYDPVPMQKVNQFLQNQGNNFIYLYGENDPWSAPAVTVSKEVNSKKYYLSDGNHFTFIKTFPKETQIEIINRLKKWITQ